MSLRLRGSPLCLECVMHTKKLSCRNDSFCMTAGSLCRVSQKYGCSRTVVMDQCEAVKSAGRLIFPKEQVHR